MEPEVSIIFVNWNAADYLRECIESIRDLTHRVAFEIIIVDNASPQPGIETLQKTFPEITLIQSGHNLGFARANNLAFKHSRGQFILFLNPDTRIINSAVDLMVDAMRALPDAGIIGCKHLSPDMSIQTCAIQKFPTILNQIADLEVLRIRFPHWNLWNITPLFSNPDRPLKVEVIPGACMLLRRQTVEKVGGFSEEYFMYGEDLDLNYKVTRLGLSNYYVGSAAIIHHGGRSSTQQTISQWATTMKYRAMLQLFRNIRGRFYASVFRAVMGCVAVARLFVLAIMFLISSFVFDRNAVREAFAKWTAVLRWALGLSQSMTLSR